MVFIIMAPPSITYIVKQNLEVFIVLKLIYNHMLTLFPLFNSSAIPLQLGEFFARNLLLKI